MKEQTQRTMRKLFGSLLVAAGIACAPAIAGNTIEDHKELWAAVESAGVIVVLNHPTECGEGAAGLYHSGVGQLVVCQDNSVRPFDHVAWTANDLDTLRHEAQHVIQDCLEGGLGDRELGRVLDRDTLAEIATDAGITVEDFQRIERVYRAQGADTHVVLLEIEAFVVAAAVEASTLARTLNNHCSLY